MAETILVADDEHGYRQPIADMFQDAGFETIEAESKEDVVENAALADVWIVDVRLPSHAREGIEAVTQVVDAGKAPTHPVIFISVDSAVDADDQLGALRAMGVDYKWYEKPFEMELLLNAVRSLLGGDSA